jgi:Carboxypeptidase regulatory-like domain
MVRPISTRDPVGEQFRSKRSVNLRTLGALAAWLLAAWVLMAPLRAQEATASLHGVVTDRDGSVCEGAQVSLAVGSESKSVLSDDQGRYSFGSLPSGPYKMTVSGKGFAAQTITGVLAGGESRELPAVVLLVTSSSQVTVTADLEEIAAAQLQIEEQQRILGVFPNFYISYAKNAAPLTTKQKYQLAWRSQIDPMSFVFTGITAGVEQSNNTPASWGQTKSGFAKRYAAAYGDGLTDTFLAGAILPSLFHQDPRYFYKGTGTVRSRIWYALSSAVICRTDSGQRQFNYSGLMGDLASAGLSNLYYPADDRNGFGLTLRNLAIGKATQAAQNILQEFVIKRFTPKVAKDSSLKP